MTSSIAAEELIPPLGVTIGELVAYFKLTFYKLGKAVIGC
jgi:hypothetical protein